ncbi:uncharacterized protein TRAVEDRAFT_96811, partial [Trametes versicolor FP-101664 SS1]|uniref:uncharacterized protein n=1 Tax=Trametes versicolor (strain FP-101664) TaxID=717944 RepID=UPI0004621AF2
MHLTDLNIPDLLLSIWRGVIKGSVADPKEYPWAVLQGDVWTAHGQQVQQAATYLPGFFDRSPRNIAEKISSGYKAAEFHTYLWNYAPAMLRHLLPPLCWQHLCKTAKSVQILHHENILLAELIKAKKLLQEATRECEEVYVERDIDRMHFVRPCLHTLWHAPDEIFRRGSLICCTQHAMERLIGNLGGEIKQPSNPYHNLSERAVLRCQTNALKAMIPELDRVATKAKTLPRGAEDLGNGFILLRALDSCPRAVSELEARAFHRYFLAAYPTFVSEINRNDFTFKAHRWARLRLPNGLVARSAWKECNKPLSKLRLARCVKFVNSNGDSEVGEVRYFCQAGPDRRAVAMVSVFGARDAQLYKDSYETIELMEYRGEADMRVVEVKDIKTVVGMIPDVMPAESTYGTDYKHLHEGCKYFVVEKLGLQVGVLVG